MREGNMLKCHCLLHLSHESTFLIQKVKGECFSIFGTVCYIQYLEGRAFGQSAQTMYKIPLRDPLRPRDRSKPENKPARVYHRGSLDQCPFKAALVCPHWAIEGN